MAAAPVGKRFSQIYLERGIPTRDSKRFRNRLAEYCLALIAEVNRDLQSTLASRMAQELGIRVPHNGFTAQPDDVFREGGLRDVLDSITLFHQALLPYAVYRDPAGRWRKLVERAMAEENVGYRIDEQGGVHYHVDQEFEHNRAAAVTVLQHPDLAAALATHDDAYRHLDSRPQDTKAAVRSIFETVEIIARLICPETKNLHRRLAEGALKQKCLAVMPQDATEQTVAASAFDGLADWIDGLHHYRHGQPLDEPAAPSEALAVYALSSGSTYARTLGDCLLRIKSQPTPAA